MKANQRLDFLDNMRAVAIVMVVGIHSMGYCQELSPSEKDILGFLIHKIAVPVFFFVDGYLLSFKYKNNDYDVPYIKFIRKSFLRLMVPWILFTLFYAAMRWGFETVNVLKEHLILGHSPGRIFFSMYASVYSQQMYFLLSLFLIRAIVPLLVFVFRLKSNYILLFLFLVYLASYKEIFSPVSALLKGNEGLDPVLHAIWGIQFYFFGVIFNRIESKLLRYLNHILFVTLSLMIILTVTMPLPATKIIVLYAYLSFFVVIFVKFKSKELYLKRLGKNTMGIYLIHCPVLMKTISIIVNKLIYNGLLSFFLIMSVSLISSYYIALLMSKNPYSRVVMGMPVQNRYRP